jgi:cytochrome c551/c552
MTLGAKIALGSLLAIAAIQVVTFARSNPPVTADIRAPEEVKSILRRACYDCHSNETVWPWYSRVAPVSWLLQSDVTEGREELNFSEWEALPPARRSKLQRKCGEEVQGGDMPPWFYTPMHPRAALSGADEQILEAWAESAPRAD